MKRLVWFAVVLGLVAAAFMLGTRFATREAAFAASADGTRAALGRRSTLLERPVPDALDRRQSRQRHQGRDARGPEPLRRNRVDQGRHAGSRSSSTAPSCASTIPRASRPLDRSRSCSRRPVRTNRSRGA